MSNAEPQKKSSETELSRETIIKNILSDRVMAAPVLIGRSDGLQMIEAIIEGGIRHIEVLMPAERGIEFLREAVKRFGTAACIGAGSVVTAEFARAVMDEGAKVVVTPVVEEEVIKTVRANSRVMICGAQTPTEILRAMRAGADFAKLFPADALSPACVSTLLVPIPQVRLIAVGGVTPRTAPLYLQAGTVAVAVGKYLVGFRDGATTRKAVVRRCQVLLASIQEKKPPGHD
jgi:2-dehydro-3-deoxyphosphogluconate aldolase/(4S)-4-hydroxy-2-oxoglutarate aldolase